MRTPAAYTKNLKEHIITSDMLLDCLYSSNKRAKNWRDKEREYRAAYRGNDYYGSEERAREQKESYYWQKDKLLSVLKPVCIHREKHVTKYRERVYDYEDDYEKCLMSGEFVHQSGYYDKELHEYVEFGVIVQEDISYNYFLFYDIGADHTFHTPIDEEDVKKYDFPVIDIGTLVTVGHDISDLLSNQFVSKVVALIQSKDFKYIA